MDTIVRPPVAPPSALVGVRGRRWPRRVLVAAIALLVASVVAGWIWVGNYDPFMQGMVGYAPLDERTRFTDVDGLGVSGRLFQLPASRATSYRYAFSITNIGPLAVRVDRIGPSAAEQTAELRFEPVGVVPDLGSADDHRAFEPWHTFVLQPDQHAGIEMQLTFRPVTCLDSKTALAHWPETVDFSIFGIHRTTEFEPEIEVRVVGTGTCP